MNKFSLILFLFLISSYSQAQWNLINQDSALLEVTDIHFFNEDLGVVCGQKHHGQGFVLKTYDGGQTWPDTVTNVLVCSSIYFISDSIGFTGGQDGIVYKTSDFGLTWNRVNQYITGLDYDGLHFFNDSIGLLKSYDGGIWKTINGGYTWDPVSNNDQNSHFNERNVNPFFSVNDSTVFAVGNGIIQTTNQGSTWSKLNADSTRFYRAITMKNDYEGFAVGNNGALLRTTDAGNNWTYDSISDQDLRDVAFLNDDIGFIVGGGFGYLNDTTGIVLQTIDGGQNWTRIKISDIRLNSIEIIDSVAYIVGNYGTIFKMDFRGFLSIEKPSINSCNLKAHNNYQTAELNFEISGNQNSRTSVTIYDLFGNVVYLGQHKKRGRVNSDKFSSGIYIISANSTCGRINKKIIIAK